MITQKLITIGEPSLYSGRTFTQAVADKIVADFKDRTNDLLGELDHHLLGELDHPDTPAINIDRVSHTVTDIFVENAELWASAEILLNTPLGKIVNQLRVIGIEPRLSMRGVGSVDIDTNEINSDFNLITIDLVSTETTRYDEQGKNIRDLFTLFDKAMSGLQKDGLL